MITTIQCDSLLEAVLMTGQKVWSVENSFHQFSELSQSSLIYSSSPQFDFWSFHERHLGISNSNKCSMIPCVKTLRQPLLQQPKLLPPTQSGRNCLVNKFAVCFLLTNSSQFILSRFYKMSDKY